jgi:hypothetical protein
VGVPKLQQIIGFVTAILLLQKARVGRASRKGLGGFESRSDEFTVRVIEKPVVLSLKILELILVRKFSSVTLGGEGEIAVCRNFSILNYSVEFKSKTCKY